jgi:excisionase family DNA binding protein
MTIPKIAYSVADACKVCSLGRTTIYAAIRRGELHVCKVGRRTLLKADVIENWLASLAALRDGSESQETRSNEAKPAVRSQKRRRTADDGR